MDIVASLKDGPNHFVVVRTQLARRVQSITRFLYTSFAIATRTAPRCRRITSHLGVGYRQVSPVLLGTLGPHAHNCLTIGEDPRAGKLRPESRLRAPAPWGPYRQGWHSLPECPGTFLRVNEGVYILRSASLAVPEPAVLSTENEEALVDGPPASREALVLGMGARARCV